MFLREIAARSVPLTLDYHEELNPKLWSDEDTLDSEVFSALKKIGNKFIEYLKIPADAIEDIIITGSNCNYNWTKYSDIDLHVVLKFDEICDNCPSFDLADCMNAKKSLWNETHDITIHGIDVELYAQSVKDAITGNAGVYSISNRKWVKRPKRERVEYDKKAIRNKAAILMGEIDELIDGSNTNSKDIERIKTKLRNMRKSGLEKHGEYSLENLAFKTLRNSGYLQKLHDYGQNIEDEELSL